MTAVPGPVGTEGGLREDETVYRINAHVEAGTACSFCGASYYACTVAVLRPYNDPLRSDGCCDRCQDCAGHETRYLSQVGGLIAEAVAADRATGAAAVPAPAPESGLRTAVEALADDLEEDADDVREHGAEAGFLVDLQVNLRLMAAQKIRDVLAAVPAPVGEGDG